MNFQITLALRYLAGRRLRTVLTTLAIVFGILLIFGMNSILPAFINSFTTNVMAMEGHVDISVTSKINSAFPMNIHNGHVRNIKQTRMFANLFMFTDL